VPGGAAAPVAVHLSRHDQSCQYDRNRTSARVKDMIGRVVSKTLSAVSFGCHHVFLWHMDLDVRDARMISSNSSTLDFLQTAGFQGDRCYEGLLHRETHYVRGIVFESQGQA